MKALSSPPSDPLLLEIQDIENRLEEYRIFVEEHELKVEGYDRNDPRRLKGLRALMEFKLKMAKEVTAVAVVKARRGIVGNSWYNGGKQ